MASVCLYKLNFRRVECNVHLPGKGETNLDPCNSATLPCVGIVWSSWIHVIGRMTHDQLSPLAECAVMKVAVPAGTSERTQGPANATTCCSMNFPY